MQLDLIDSGLYVVKGAKVRDFVRIKVAHADSADFALFVKLAHRSPRAVAVVVRLMNHIKVYVVKS